MVEICIKVGFGDIKALQLRKHWITFSNSNFPAKKYSGFFVESLRRKGTPACYYWCLQVVYADPAGRWRHALEAQ